MKIIENEISRAISENSLDVYKLNLNEANRMRKDIKLRFCMQTKYSYLWESLKDSEQITDADGWNKISEYVGDNTCIMFLEENDDKNFYVIKNGNDLNTLLGDTFGFEFYITNKTLEYLICFSHHDILYGCGKAKSWVGSLK